MFTNEDNDQFELIYPACPNWPLLRAYFGYLLDGIEIDSADAKNARAHLKQMNELREKRRPPAVEDLPGEIEGLLRRAEGGEWQAWWQLNLALMLTPDSRGIGDELSYVIASMPGWLTAGQADRGRIITTATRYLIDAETSAHLWFGQQSMRLHRNDLAALRAFILLLQMAPDDYARIPVAAWNKWAPVIVGLPRKGVADGSSGIATILHDALTKAPATFIASVRALISMDKHRARASTEPSMPNSIPSFFILRDLEGCWADRGLKDAVFEEMQASDLSPAEYAALLDPLLKANHEPAIEHAVAWIAGSTEDILAIADVLLRGAPARVWPILWPRLVVDEDFARALLMHAADSAYYTVPFYTAIGVKAVADLYLLMVRLFPPEADPEASSGFVSSLDLLPTLRDGTVRHLAAIGSGESVQALMRLAAARHDIPLLPFEMSRGEVEMRLKTWSPLTAKEVLALTDHPGAKLISSAADLLEILLKRLGPVRA